MSWIIPSTGSSGDAVDLRVCSRFASAAARGNRQGAGEMSVNRENSVQRRMMGKRRPATTTTTTTRRPKGRGAYSYARIVCAVAVAHGCLCRGATLAIAAPPGRRGGSMLAAAGEAAGGTSATGSSTGPDRALFDIPARGGSRGDAGRGTDREAPSTAAEAIFHT